MYDILNKEWKRTALIWYVQLSNDMDLVRRETHVENRCD